MAAKTAPPASNKTAGQATQGANAQVQPAISPPPKPKPSAGGTSHWLDTLSDVKVGEPDQPPRPKIPSSPAPREQRSGPERPGYRGPGDHRDERGASGNREGSNRGPGGYKEGGYHSPAAYRVGDISVSIGQRPRQPMEPGVGRGPRPGSPGEARPEKRPSGGRPEKPKAAKPTPPKPKREKIPPPPPFKPTPEQVAQVEARYKELAVPAEFDGIRTQIAKELSIPKKAVKQIIKDLREREDIPSWWDMQTYKGDSEELEKIRAAYEVHLPLPPIGVHKQIADALSIKPGPVYQAIKLIRQEMDLPQYNDPALHGLELIPKKQKKVEPQAEAELSPAANDVSPSSNNVTPELQGEEKAESHLEAEPSSTTTSVSLSGEDSARTTETTEAATIASDSDGAAEAQ
jgi:hypothetical protein